MQLLFQKREFDYTSLQKIVSSLRQETAIAFPAVVGLGGELADVQKIQLGITKELNTNVITMGETVTGLYAGAKAVGVASENVGVMVEKFQSAGIQVDNIHEVLQSTVDTARALGVNTSAAFTGVQNNLDKINKMAAGGMVTFDVPKSSSLRYLTCTLFQLSSLNF